MKIYDEKYALKNNFVPDTEYLDHTEYNVCLLLRRNTMNVDFLTFGRKTILVENDAGKIALFVIKLKKSDLVLRHTRYKSKSGRYRNIRHLVEFLFAENPELKYSDFTSHIKREFPSSAVAQNPEGGMNNYKQWKHQIVTLKIFKYVEIPDWAK